MSYVKVHELKIQEKYYQKVVDGRKTAELRYNDRDFKVGELIKLFVSSDHLPCVWLVITDITEYPTALRDGYVMLSFKRLTKTTYYCDTSPLITKDQPTDEWNQITD